MYVDFVRGGAPSRNLAKVPDSAKDANIQVTYELNNVYLPNYDKEIFNPKTLTKFQVSVLLGIELFYGNYKEYLIYILAKEDSYFARLFEVNAKLQEAIDKTSFAMIEEGAAAIDRMREEHKKYFQELQKLKEKLSIKIAEVSKRLGISEKEISDLIIPLIGGTIQG